MTEFPQYHQYGISADTPVYSYFHLEHIREVAENFDWNFKPHSHPNIYQMIWVEKGSGQFSVDGTTMEFADNWVCFIAPNTVHAISFSPRTIGKSLYFTHDFLSLGYLGNMLQEFIGNVNIPFCKATDIPPELRGKWERIFNSLTQEFQNINTAGRNACIRAWMLLLLTEIIRINQKFAPHTKNMRHETVVNNFLDLLENYYTMEKNTTFYAQKLHVSTDTLNNHVKSILNRSASKVIRERILLEAKRQLLYSDKSTSQIALDLNFTDDSYFVRFFKRETGTTPHKYKKSKHDPIIDMQQHNI